MAALLVFDERRYRGRNQRHAATTTEMGAHDIGGIPLVFLLQLLFVFVFGLIAVKLRITSKAGRT